MVCAATVSHEGTLSSGTATRAHVAMACTVRASFSAVAPRGTRATTSGDRARRHAVRARPGAARPRATGPLHVGRAGAARGCAAGPRVARPAGRGPATGRRRACLAGAGWRNRHGRLRIFRSFDRGIALARRTRTVGVEGRHS